MTATQKAKKLKDRYKRHQKKLMRERWSQNQYMVSSQHAGKRVHLHRTVISMDEVQWTLKVTAGQDHNLSTRYYSKHITKQSSTDKHDMCHNQPETVEHIISSCQGPNSRAVP